MTSLLQALDQAQKFIDRLDAQLLLSHVLSKPRSYLISWPDRDLTQGEFLIFESLVQQRYRGYPLAYITGMKSFWDMELIVTPDVLIPRPETELLVEIALSKSGSHVLELATGSGAIACALARELPDLKITATDISDKALKIAVSNASKYHLTNINFIHSDWFASISDQRFDLIIANPPYLSETDPHLTTDIRFEPRHALVSGKHGDEDYITIISQAGAYLNASGWLLLEHGAEQGSRLRSLLEEYGFMQIFTARDLAGLERVSGGVL